MCCFLFHICLNCLYCCIRTDYMIAQFQIRLMITRQFKLFLFSYQNWFISQNPNGKKGNPFFASHQSRDLMLPLAQTTKKTTGSEWRMMALLVFFKDLLREQTYLCCFNSMAYLVSCEICGGFFQHYRKKKKKIVVCLFGEGITSQHYVKLKTVDLTQCRLFNRKYLTRPHRHV